MSDEWAMKNKIQLAVLLVSFLTGGVTGGIAETMTNLDMPQAIESIRKKHDLPALAVMVVKDGQIATASPWASANGVTRRR